MNDQYRLMTLGNSQLMANLEELVRQSDALTGQLLAHLVEIEKRLLHLDLGFSSLFSYCVEALGMSEGAAGRRVTAARVCKRFPDAFERVARGEIHLCALCALAPHLNSDNASELFDASRGKTRRQVEELLAARFPRPDFREQIRRLPARASGPVSVAQQASSGAAKPIAETAAEANANGRIGLTPGEVENDPPLAGPAPTIERRFQRQIEPLTADRFGVRFTADAELRELIDRARALASHRLPNGDLASLIKLMTRAFVQQEEKRRFGIGARARKATKRASVATEPTLPSGAPESPARLEAEESISGAGRVQEPPATRYVSVSARREVHERDGGRCAFISATGRRCNARVRLEIDHVTPVGLGGTAAVHNLRLLCRAHNQLHARRCFGDMHIAAKTSGRQREGRCHAAPSSQSAAPRARP